VLLKAVEDFVDGPPCNVPDSHILLWYTLTQLAELQRLVGTEVIRTPVAEWAASVRAGAVGRSLASW
jgi:hypothetical protein